MAGFSRLAAKRLLAGLAANSVNSTITTTPTAPSSSACCDESNDTLLHYAARTYDRASHTHTQTHRHCTLVHAVCRSPRVCTATDTVRATLFVTGGDAVSFVICDSRLTPLRTRRLCCFHLLGKGGALRPRLRSTRLSTAPSSSSARLVQTRPGSTDHAMMRRESRKSRLYSGDETAVLLLALWISSAAAVAACM